MTAATILVVDDRAVDRRYLVLLLEHHGHRVLEATSGDQALELVRTEKPDLVITDILMPNDGGYRFVLRLAVEPDIVLPQVLFRAAAEVVREAGVLAQACGVAHVVTQFAEPESFLAVIDAILTEPPVGPVRASLAEPAVVCEHLSAIAQALYRHMAEVESRYAIVDQRAIECSTRLDLARSALGQEVAKRLRAEKALTQANQCLRAQAVRDPLTGVFNRRFLEESLNREESRARRSQKPLGVIMIDIDHFKRFNDTFGHAAGDKVLRAISDYMQSVARSEDILCRYGGEEFVLLMANATPAALMERAEMLRKGARKLNIEFNGRDIGPVTLSAGIALFPDHGNDIRAAMAAADAALYLAKDMGRDRVISAQSEQEWKLPI